MEAQENNVVLLHELIAGLNPNQSLAVTHSYDKNCLTIAGAGSGKTNVITKRIAFIIGNGHPTSSVLAVTFTNKAADEMRKRVAKFIGKQNAKKIMMGTFHSICVEMLRQFGRDIGVPRYFTIYDTGDSKQILKETLLEVTGTTDDNLVKSCREKISNMKNNLIDVHEANMRALSPEDRLVASAYGLYQQKLAMNKALDFDDLIMKTVFLLRTSAKAKSYCNNRFRFVMADEVQDTNDAQYELLELIAGNNNIFLVGDDSQSIYGWRGANIDNILKFEKKYPNCRIIKLEQNYRSTKVIVDAGNALITHNKHRLDKTCFSVGSNGDLIKVHKAYNDKQECKFIVNEIKNLIFYGNKKPSDIAVLCRVNKLTRELEDQLMSNGIPYEVVAGLSFYDRKEIKDVTAILKSTINPHDDAAFKRYLDLTPRVGKDTIKQIKELARKNNCSLFDAVQLYNGRSKGAIEQGLKILTKLLGFINSPIEEFIQTAITITGYIQRLNAVNSKENQERVENVEELINVAAQFTQNHENTQNDILTSFLDRVALSSDTDAKTDEDRVKLLTIHSSKGLEFNTVFIMACEENILPHKNSQSSELDIEEERRLMYVAITRTEESLYITYSGSRMVYGKIEHSMISRFISEIPSYLKMEIW